MADIQALLNEMTIEEKCGQLTQILPEYFFKKGKGEVTGPLKALNLNEEAWECGSVLGLENPEDMIQIQKTYLEMSRHKIPLLFMADVIHGYRTVFPVPLAQGCSWNPELVEACSGVAAKEAAVSGNHVTFSPMADLVRDPRWGRVIESTGEDAYLNGKMAAAMVRGYQGNLDNEHIAACVKHFAAYGASEGGRDYNTVDMSDWKLRQDYLPAYQAAIEAGAELVMTSFNTVHGVPATANAYLLDDILRKEWGFEGVVISDWEAVEELIPHGVASDGKEAAEKALTAGVDIEMMSSNYVKHLKQSVEEGKIPLSILDKAVYRVLKLKEKLGLFENPYRGADSEKAKKICGCMEHRMLARRAACESMVLLKNEGVLPISSEQKVALIGPFVKTKCLLGAWSLQGKREETVSVLEGMKKRLSSEQILIAEGCQAEGADASGIEEAVQTARKADVILMLMGEDEEMGGEAGSRASIRLPGIQETLIHEIAKLKKPMAVILFNGRPLEMKDWIQEVPAVLEAWYLGTEAGNAVADLVFGDVSPSGRLSMSIPYTVGQIPVYYNHYRTGRPEGWNPESPRYTSTYLDIPNAPLFPFGYGLSYTEFAYGDLKLSDAKVQKGGSLTASITVKNIGVRSGVETVQFYICDQAGSVVRPVKELKAFQKVQLEPGEEKEATFYITEEMLKFYDASGCYQAETGQFQAMVGHDSEHLAAADFELTD